MTTRATQADRDEARDRLRAIIKPGDTIHCVLRHVSRSGMYRAIDLYKLEKDDDGRVFPLRLSFLAARAMGDRYDERHQAIGVSGAGMDMGFHLVYNLGWALFGGEEWDCPGPRCPSNAHSNGQREYGGGITHDEAGYSLRQEWM
jgi:hypothetical protein